MKHTLILGVIFLLVFNASLALADGITDPQIHTGADTDATPVGLTFTFTSNSTGGGYFSDFNGGPGGFVNASGVDWTSLLIEVPTAYVDGSPIVDPNDYLVFKDLLFANVDVTVDSTSVTILLYGVGGDYSGIT